MIDGDNETNRQQRGKKRRKENSKTTKQIKYTWKVSSLLPGKCHTCACKSPLNKHLPAPRGREERCCLFVTVLCLRVCHRLRSSRSACDQNLDYTQLWHTSMQSHSSTGHRQYFGLNICVNIITVSELHILHHVHLLFMQFHFHTSPFRKETTYIQFLVL